MQLHCNEMSQFTNPSCSLLLFLMLLFYCLILTENWDKIIEYKHDQSHGHGVMYDMCCVKGEPEYLW